MKFLGTIIKINENGSLSLTDIPGGLSGLSIPADVLIGYSQQTAKPFTILDFELTKKRLIVKIKQINSYERAKQYIENGIFIEPDLLQFENDDGNFISDLLNCSVIDIDTEEIIGTLSDVYTMPANDVWIVKTDEGELPLPAVKEVIKDVNVEKGLIYIKMIDGLKDLIE
jgi:16S rRNA processing protein RimM